MSITPDPFLPWRPTSSSDKASEPSVNPLSPAHPIGQEEPSSPRRDRKEQAISSGVGIRQRYAREQFFVACSVMLIFAVIVLLYVEGGSHVTRGLAAAVCLWLGLLLGLLVLDTLSPARRFLLLAGGVVLAVGCWCLVPTTTGVNLVDAQLRLNELRRLEGDDPDRFFATVAARAEILEAFPSWKGEMDQAERAWVRRHVSAELDRIEREEQEDLPQAMKRLRDLRHQVMQTAHNDEDRQRIEAVRQEVLKAWLRVEETKLRKLLRKGKYASVYQQVATLVRMLSEEAAELKPEEDLQAQILSVCHDAMCEHVEAARIDLERLLAKKDYAGVAVQGAKYLREVKQGAASLFGNAEEQYDKLRVVRGKALQARLEKAKVDARELLVKDRYQAMGELGEKTFADLAEEARVVGLESDLTRFRDSCRVFADLANKAKIEDRK